MSDEQEKCNFPLLRKLKAEIQSDEEDLVSPFQEVKIELFDCIKTAQENALETKKTPKTAAERGREFRARKNLTKIKKIPKTSAQRNRECRARKKVLEAVENNQQQDKSSTSVLLTQNVSDEKCNSHLFMKPKVEIQSDEETDKKIYKSCYSLSFQEEMKFDLPDYVKIEPIIKNEQLEDEILINTKSKPKTSTERSRECRERKKAKEIPKIKKPPKTAAERKREYLARQKLFKAALLIEQTQLSTDPTDISRLQEVISNQLETGKNATKQRKTSTEQVRAWRARKRETTTIQDPPKMKNPPKTSAERKRAWRARQKLLKAVLLIQQSQLNTESLDNPSFQDGKIELADREQLENIIGTDSEKPRNTSTERVRAWRERKKLLKPDVIEKPIKIKNPPKTPAERKRAYRERQKLIKAALKQETNAKKNKNPPKTSAERKRAWRARQKLLKASLNQQNQLTNGQDANVNISIEQEPKIEIEHEEEITTDSLDLPLFLEEIKTELYNCVTIKNEQLEVGTGENMKERSQEWRERNKKLLEAAQAALTQEAKEIKIKNPPKTPAERKRAYKERQKLLKTAFKQEVNAKNPPKTAAQRNRECRARKKLLNAAFKEEANATKTKNPPKTSAERKRAWRARQKLLKALNLKPKATKTKNPPKTSAERKRAWRERQKLLKINQESQLATNSSFVKIEQLEGEELHIKEEVEELEEKTY